MRHAILAGLAFSLVASGAMAQGTAGPKSAKAAKVETPAVTSADADKNKAQLLTEKRQREWDRKSGLAMKSICSNC